MPDAAPATPAAAPPATPAVASHTATLAKSFDARVALAKSLGSAPRLPGEPIPTGKPARAVAPAPVHDEGMPGGETPAPAPGEETPEPTEPEPPAEEGDGAGDEGDADEATEKPGETASPGTPEERVTAGLAALAKGDIEGLVRALGGDTNKVSAPTKLAFRAHARRIAKLESEKKTFEGAKATAHAELSGESNRLSALQRGLADRYEPADAARQAWEHEDFLAVGKALERQFKTDLATLTQKLASGKTGKTPDERKLADRERDLAAREAALEAKAKATETSKTVAQKRGIALERAGEALKSHPYLITTGADGAKTQDADALAEVFGEYERSWNGEKFTKTLRGCADELQEKLVARARARGLVPGAPAANGKGANGKPALANGKAGKPAGKPLAEPPRTVARKDLGSPADLDATRAARLAAAKRTTEMQMRGLKA